MEKSLDKFGQITTSEHMNLISVILTY